MPDLRDQLQATLRTAYTVDRELGGGGMSRVFVATDTAPGRQVVVKVLPPELSEGVNVDRFRREIQLAAQLLHPHIVPLLSAGESDGLPFYTMPFVEGESLRARLTREHTLPIEEAVALAREIASALDYAHRRASCIATSLHDAFALYTSRLIAHHLMFHECAQDGVHSRLVAGPRLPEPIDDLPVEPQRNGLLADGSHELSRRQPRRSPRWIVGITGRGSFRLRIGHTAEALPICTRLRPLRGGLLLCSRWCRGGTLHAHHALPCGRK